MRAGAPTKTPGAVGPGAIGLIAFLPFTADGGRREGVMVRLPVIPGGGARRGTCAIGRCGKWGDRVPRGRLRRMQECRALEIEAALLAPAFAALDPGCLLQEERAGRRNALFRRVRRARGAVPTPGPHQHVERFSHRRRQPGGDALPAFGRDHHDAVFHPGPSRLDRGDRRRERERRRAAQLRRLGQAALARRPRRPGRQHHQPDHARLHRPGESRRGRSRPPQRAGRSLSLGRPNGRTRGTRWSAA